MSKTLMTIGTGILCESYEKIKECLNEKLGNKLGNLIGANIENDHYQWNDYSGILVAEAILIPDNDLSKLYDSNLHVVSNSVVEGELEIINTPTKPWRLWIKGVNA